MQTNENSHDADYRDLRVLVVAPSGRDALLICQLLNRTGIASEKCATCDESCLEMVAGAGAIIVAEEALNPEEIRRFAALVADQPAWSDFPMILLTVAGAVSASSQRRRELRTPLGNVLLLERPIRPETLISTVQSALRARRRQYQLRDQIQQQKQSEEALRKSEKLAVVGRLAATMAHEINNPLSAVTNLAYPIRTCASLEKSWEYAAMAEEELKRIAEIVAHTLHFYRQPMRGTTVNIPEVLDSVLMLYRGRLRSANITVEKRYVELPSIYASAGELRQVFANLVGNALDAMSRGGILRVRARGATEFGYPPRKGVRVIVADTGLGIPVEFRRSIFEPFVSTKGSTGTGLGLWVSSQIVEKHAGTIRLKTSVAPQKSGTIFSVFLPLDHAYAESLKFNEMEEKAGETHAA